jgi:hypothetical protein
MPQGPILIASLVTPLSELRKWDRVRLPLLRSSMPRRRALSGLPIDGTHLRCPKCGAEFVPKQRRVHNQRFVDQVEGQGGS